jgi:hypothetical protein
MSQRTTHIITSECEIFVQRITKDCVRCRVVETDPELVNPTDFEIEGDPAHIAEALSAICAVINNIDKFLQEPS